MPFARVLIGALADTNCLDDAVVVQVGALKEKVHRLRGRGLEEREAGLVARDQGGAEVANCTCSFDGFAAGGPGSLRVVLCQLELGRGDVSLREEQR